MAHFSGAIKLADGINDYLAPSQDCVLPLMTSKNQGTSAKISTGQGADFDLLQSRIENASQPSGLDASNVPGAEFGQMKSSSDGAKATITLADCLSCSGCVTTAETVLISQHSSQQLIAKLQAMHAYMNPHHQKIQISISMAPLLSLANALNLDIPTTFGLLKVFFHALGVTNFIYAVDSHAYVLHESAQEFITRYRNRARLMQTALPLPHPQGPSDHDDTNQPFVRLLETPSHTNFAQASLASSDLPLLSSECPGWVCLSEKTQGEKMIPFMSAVRTPQSLLGLYAKLVIDGDGDSDTNSSAQSTTTIPHDDAKNTTSPRHYTVDPDIYHITIMPCYDKKLEATREFIEIYPTSTTTDAVAMPFVDLVLSTHELVDMLLGNVQLDDSTPQIDSPISVQSITDLWMDVWAQYIYHQDSLREDGLNQDHHHHADSQTNNDNDTDDNAHVQHQEEDQQQQQERHPDPLSIDHFNFEIHPFVSREYIPSIRALGKDDLIYRPPGKNTSSGGYAETIFYEGLKDIYQVQFSQPDLEELYNLAWTPLTNNDVKMVTCEYLGVGTIINSTSSSPSETLSNVGIYAILGREKTVITHGAVIPTASLTSPLFTMNKRYHTAKQKCAKIAPLSTGGVNTACTEETQKAQPVRPSGRSALLGMDEDDIAPQPPSIRTGGGRRRGKDDGPSLSANCILPSTSQHLTYCLKEPVATPLCVLSVSTAFGLRNIQSIIRQLDPTSSTAVVAPLRLNQAQAPTTPAPSAPPEDKTDIHTHYVEIMSCPSGCINGGAQLAASQINILRSTLTSRLRDIHVELVKQTKNITNAEEAEQLFKASCGNFSDVNTKQPLITQQRAHLANIQTLYEALPCVYDIPSLFTHPHPSSQRHYDATTTAMMDDGHDISGNVDASNQTNDVQLYYSPYRSTIFQILQHYRIQLMYTKYNPIQVNETLQALRW